MDRASPQEMRKALKVVDEFKKAGILFVPMPAKNIEECEILRALSIQMLENNTKTKD